MNSCQSLCHLYQAFTNILPSRFTQIGLLITLLLIYIILLKMIYNRGHRLGLQKGCRVRGLPIEGRLPLGEYRIVWITPTNYYGVPELESEKPAGPLLWYKLPPYLPDFGEEEIILRLGDLIEVTENPFDGHTGQRIRFTSRPETA